MAISISIIFSLCSEQLVSILFGDQFIESANILSVYVWSIVFVFINSAQWKWYLVMGYQKLALRRLIVGAALNIVLNIIFIKLFGLIGAAYATVLSYAYVGYFGNLISRKLRINFLLISKALFCPWLGIKSITLRLKK
jgi:O-antigen/teichoic acid export membrane protein